MTIAGMLEQSGSLALLGMGIVFSFLVILIVCITLAGKVIHAVGADKDLRQPLAASAGGAGRPAQAGGGNDAVTAAISAAVSEYGKSHS